MQEHKEHKRKMERGVARWQMLLYIQYTYLDESTGTPPTDWTQVAPKALAIRPSLLQRDKQEH